MTKSRWRAPFTVKKLEFDASKKWIVLETKDLGPDRFSVERVSEWRTRDEAREAARQLNQEERRYA